jgi:hypothetical protein
LPLSQVIHDNLGEWLQLACLAAVPFHQFAGWIKSLTHRQSLLERSEDSLAIAHQPCQIKVQHPVDVMFDGRIIRANPAIALKVNLVLDGASWVADAEAQNIIAFASIAMLLTLRLPLTAKAGTMQVAEIELSTRMSVLALPMLNLHALGRWPDAGLAIAAEAPLLSDKRDS